MRYMIAFIVLALALALSSFAEFPLSAWWLWPLIASALGGFFMAKWDRSKPEDPGLDKMLWGSGLALLAGLASGSNHNDWKEVGCLFVFSWLIYIFAYAVTFNRSKQAGLETDKRELAK